MSSPTNDNVLGVVVLIRHGDRQGFFQSPTTYTASKTNLTVLGYMEEFNSGSQLRSRYLDPASPYLIQGVNTTQAENSQILVQADAGGEGSVIVESANAFMQGLFPPFDDSITLANGTGVSWANRAQLIPVQTIDPDDSYVMEPWTSCPKFDKWTQSFYDSADFKQQSALAQPFYNSLPTSLLQGRPANLVNAWNIFDLLNVENIHNGTIAPQITDEMVSNARFWAEYHENGLFGGSQESDISSIAGCGILNPIVESVNRVANASDPLKVSVLAASYKPFFALFNMFQIPQLQGKLVDYASALAFEIHADSWVQLYFRNGSDAPLAPYSFGQKPSGYAVDTFAADFGKVQIDTLAGWCNACGQTKARGCAALNALNNTGSGCKYADVDSTTGRHQVSPVVAGVIGSLVSLAFAIVIVAALTYFTGLTVVKRGKGSYPKTKHLLAPGSVRTDNSVELRSDLDRKDSHVV